MRIVIVGAGKVGMALTQQLSAEHRVTVIDQEPQLINNIINVYDVMGICGNGASYEIQMEAEASKAELLIATTSSDEINILACLVAKKLGVKHTIARIRNPEYEKQLLHAGGVGTEHGHQPGEGGRKGDCQGAAVSHCDED